MVNRAARDKLYEFLMSTVDDELDEFTDEQKLMNLEEIISGHVNTIVFILDNDKHYYRKKQINNKYAIDEYTQYIYRWLIFLKTDIEFIPLDDDPFKRIFRYIVSTLFGRDIDKYEQHRRFIPFLNEKTYWNTKRKSDLSFEMIEQKMRLLFGFGN